VGGSAKSQKLHDVTYIFISWTENSCDCPAFLPNRAWPGLNAALAIPVRRRSEKTTQTSRWASLETKTTRWSSVSAAAIIDCRSRPQLSARCVRTIHFSRRNTYRPNSRLWNFPRRYVTWSAARQPISAECQTTIRSNNRCLLRHTVYCNKPCTFSFFRELETCSSLLNVDIWHSNGVASVITYFAHLFQSSQRRQ